MLCKAFTLIFILLMIAQDLLLANASAFSHHNGHGRLKKKRSKSHNAPNEEEFDTEFLSAIESDEVIKSTALNNFQRAFHEVEAEEKHIVDVFVKDGIDNKHRKQTCKKKYVHLKKIFIDSKKHEKEELIKLKSLKQGLADIISTFKVTENDIVDAQQENLEMKGQLISLQDQLLLAQRLEEDLATLQKTAKLNYETGKLEFDRHNRAYSADTVKRLEKKAADPAIFNVNLQFLFDVALLFFVSALGGILSKLFKLPPLVGYIIGGSLIGPNSLDLVHYIQEVFTISQFGSIFFLFSHGLKYNLNTLRGNFNSSLLTFIVSTTLIAFVFALLLQKLNICKNMFDGLLSGIAVSLSSLTIVLQYLHKLNIIDTRVGKFVLSYMTLQGLFMGFIFAIPSLLTFSDWEKLFPYAAFLIFFCIISRVCVKHVVQKWGFFIDHNDEVYVLGVAAFALIFSIITEMCGLSLDLGAFIAGLLLAGTKLSQRTAKVIQPLASVFAGSLFASLGMLLNPQFFYNNLSLILTLVCLIMSLKGFILKNVAAVVGRHPVELAHVVGISMAHVGEFSLLFTSKLNIHKFLDRRLYLLLLTATVTSILASTIILKFSTLFVSHKRKLKQVSSLNLQI